MLIRTSAVGPTDGVAIFLPPERGSCDRRARVAGVVNEGWEGTARRLQTEGDSP